MLKDLLSQHSESILWITSISVAAFVISIVVLPIVIIRLPEDFFIKAHSDQVQRSPLRLLLKILKNLLGAFLLLMGLVMLFIPGQGVLTMLFGITLMDFPGKRRLEVKIVSKPRVSRSLNWLRRKANRPPFQLPE